MRIRLSTDEPKIDSSISAKMRFGIDISTSTARDRSWSIQPRQMAAKKPERLPTAKDRSVVMSGDADGVAGAIDEAGEHVAAELVGAEQELAAPGLHRARRQISASP